MEPKTSSDATFIKITHEVMKETFYAILRKNNMSTEKAEVCSELFMRNSLEGVYSHGVNRFPRFVAYIQDGYVKVDNEAVCTYSNGTVEQWDGQLGPGILNALQCTGRVMNIASEQGIGCVALSNTNHWMRGGAYGWKAAKAGFIFMGWTNTLANMPAWGAIDNKLGNNPLVLAVPYFEEAIVLDMAMSQFSYGALEAKELSGEVLPVPGGFDSEGEMTADPSAILESKRIMPAGFWKGAGLSLLLDIFSTILSGGLSTAAISKKPAEHAVSQVFIAIDLKKLPQFPVLDKMISDIIKDYKNSTTESNSQPIVYPGENIVKTKRKNLEEGIPVNEVVWNEIKALL